MDEARERAIQSTVSLAKRQRTFFRRDPRITWVEPDAATDVTALVRHLEEAGWTS
jgi:tRNA A37 N6-isopentenylltransferase MiaA